MNVLFERTFMKDIEKIRAASVRLAVRSAIETVKAAETPQLIQGMRKMNGYSDFYRIRIGDYRIGLRITDSTVIFVRLLHRKDIYK
jgi:mRNA interferase RelE/StbE